MRRTETILKRPIRHKEKTGCSPVFSLHLKLALPPAPFHKNPAVVTMFPARSDPHSVRTWRRHPYATAPDVAMAIPCVVAGLPNPSRMRGRSIVLHHGRRWPNMNVDLSI